MSKKKQLLLSILGILMILICVVGYYAIGFLEQGFDDGPFYGREFSGDLKLLSKSESILYKDGDISVYNRDSTQSPILAYQKSNGELKWAMEMEVSTNPNFKKYSLYKIDNISVSNGYLRDVIIITGYWTFGAEQGRAFVWKFTDGFHRFYLSW